MEKKGSVDISISLVIGGAVLAIPAVTLLGIFILVLITGAWFAVIIFGLVSAFLMTASFIMLGLPDNKPYYQEVLYITDWRGNTTWLETDIFLPFRDILFTTKKISLRNRTTTEIRHIGVNEWKITAEWRPDAQCLDQFMQGNEEDKAHAVITEFAQGIFRDYTIDFCPEIIEKQTMIRDYAKGIIVTHLTAERIIPPEPEPEPEEEWMNYDDLQIGVKNGEPVFLSLEDTVAHIQIIGASRFGKSKLIEHVARQLMEKYNEGLCVIDPNQQLYDDLLTWCVHREYGDGSIYLLDPSDEKSTTGFDPFILRGEATPERITAHANRMLRTTLKALGLSGDTAIQAQRIIRCLYYVLIEQNLPITELKAFFTPRLFDRRDEIMANCKSEDIRDQWDMLTAGKKTDAYVSMMQSSANRLFEFISEGSVQKIFSNPHPLDFYDISERGDVVLINLGRSDTLPVSARNVIGTFLVDEIWHVMSSRKRDQVEKLPHFNLMVDEFQNFATPDFAEMLKEGAKYRLHLWLINHVLSDLDRNVKNALNACHTRIAFGGTMQQDAAFVLEGSIPREDGELRDDIELVPRLAKRRFMLRRQGKRNIVCETPDVAFYPVESSLKEEYLDDFAREPFEPETEDQQPEEQQPESEPQTESEAPKPKVELEQRNPFLEAIKQGAKELEEQKRKTPEKNEEVPPDEFYY